MLSIFSSSSTDGIFKLSDSLDYSKNTNSAILAKTTEMRKILKQHINDGLLTEYLKSVFEVIAIANRYVNDTEPWKLIKTDMSITPYGISRMAHLL